LTLFKKKKKTLHARINFWGKLFFVPFAVAFLAFGLFPILYSLFLSFMEYDGIRPMKFIGLENFEWVFIGDGAEGFWRTVLNVLRIMVVYIPLNLIGALLIALIMFNRRTRPKRLMQVMCFLPSVTCSVAVGIIFALLFDYDLGIINKLLMRWGFITENINWMGSAFPAWCILLLMMCWGSWGSTSLQFLGGLGGISDEIIEASIIDGSNYFQRLIYVILPSIRNVFLFIVINGFIGTFQIMDQPRMLFSSWAVTNTIGWGAADSMVFTPAWMLYNMAYSATKLGRAAAVAYAMAMVSLVFSILNFKVLLRSWKEGE